MFFDLVFQIFIINLIWQVLSIFVKPIIIKNKILPFGTYKGMQIQPFVFSKGELTQLEKVHEFTHIRQQRYYTPILFFIIYLFDFFMNYLKYKDWSRQYYQIDFEQEQFKSEDEFNLKYSDEEIDEYLKQNYFNA